MEVIFDRSFQKDLTRLKDKTVKKQLLKSIFEAENATSIKDIRGIKKLKGFKNFYRIRIGNHRVGLEYDGSGIVRFITVVHRKEIYRVFP